MSQLARNIALLPTVFKALKELDTGIINHSNWLKQLHQQLICAGQLDTSDPNMFPDAHHLCEFGCWYDGNNESYLVDNPLFAKVGTTHKAMHDRARDLLLKRTSAQSIKDDEYNDFMDKAIAFKLEVRSLQYDLMSEICTVDHLTGAWNRHAMHYKLSEEHERVSRSGQVCMLCMMDIDHFKNINDNYGHTVGDSVLRHVTQFVTERLRKYDSMFRYGGEEFLLCLPTASEQEAMHIIERIRSELAASPVPIGQQGDIQITASFGIASIDHGHSLDESITLADQALMVAKTTGRNRVYLWGDEVSDINN